MFDDFSNNQVIILGPLRESSKNDTIDTLDERGHTAPRVAIVDAADGLDQAASAEK